jgi:hypothetical protein
MTAIVPVVSIGHYLWFCYSGLAHQDPENKINNWLMIFPMMGFFMFLQYVFEFERLAQYFMEQMEQNRDNKQKLYDEKSLLNEFSRESRRLPPLKAEEDKNDEEEED